MSFGRLSSISKSTEASTLRFITREAAAEESKGVMEKARKLEQQVKDQAMQISELKLKSMPFTVFLYLCLQTAHLVS